MLCILIAGVDTMHLMYQSLSTITIDHSELFADKHNHISGIKNFWNQAKRHLRKFNGVPKAHFHLFLQEYEWRFNNSDSKLQLKQLKQWVKAEIS